MTWEDIKSKLDREQGALWSETEAGTDRTITYRVSISKWSEVIGTANVKAFVQRSTPNPHGGPARYLGVSSFPIRLGAIGFEVAKSSAMLDALQTRERSEGGSHEV